MNTVHQPKRRIRIRHTIASIVIVILVLPLLLWIRPEPFIDWQAKALVVGGLLVIGSPVLLVVYIAFLPHDK
jgi:hypothetical protein